MPPRKGAKGYRLPERLAAGLELTAVDRSKWRLGTPLARGGFGEIYSAAVAGSKSSDASHVIKIEPHENGPLFVEMHFYMRNSKKADIEEFMKTRKLKYLGIPMYIASGSHEYNGTKYRFLVMERYGGDLWTKFLECGKIFPVHTVFRIAIQMIDAYEYIHSRYYVHGDLKGSNILFGSKKGTENYMYLVDFGLASHYTVKEFKVDPKKAHNGTIEYTSRDAHNGVPTRRGDMEILGYNIVQWLTGSLPWESNLRHPKEVQASKEKYMSDVRGFLRKTFPKSAPHAVVSYLEYVAKMKYDETPDYDLCRSMFTSGLKTLGYGNSCTLDFTPEKSAVKGLKSVIESDRTDSSELESPVVKKPEVKPTRKRKLGPKSDLIENVIVKTNPKKKANKRATNKKSSSITSDESTLANDSAIVNESLNMVDSTVLSERSLRSSRNTTNNFNGTACSVDIFEDSCVETPPKMGTKRKHKKRFEIEYCTDEEVTVHTTVKKKDGIVKENTKSWKKFPTVVNGKFPNKETS